MTRTVTTAMPKPESAKELEARLLMMMMMMMRRRRRRRRRRRKVYSKLTQWTSFQTYRVPCME